MKKVFICFLALILSSACSSDDRAFIAAPEASTALYFEREGDTLPNNSENPYDSLGQLQYELFSSFYETAAATTDLDSVIHSVELLVFSSQRFVPLQRPTYEPLTAARIQDVLTTPLHMETTLAASGMTSTAQAMLTDFIAASVDYCDASYDFEAVYSLITAYEAAVLADSSLTVQDREILLVTSSVIRHSIYTKKKKRPKKNTDPEWDLMVGTFRGAVDGAVHDPAHAVLFSVVAGIWENR